jgi:hypothetical protein
MPARAVAVNLLVGRGNRTDLEAGPLHHLAGVDADQPIRGQPQSKRMLSQ